ncbi:porin [Amylibacter sp.]|nr:porin [Amylibacter sp.]MDC1252098.1 porin [Amylibacter sp.]
MKKLLIATTALVATAGMASADITITGHAAAGIYSGLDFTKAVAGSDPATDTAVVASTLNSTTGALTAGSLTALVMPTTADPSSDAEKKAGQEAVAEAREDLAQAKANASSTLKTVADAELALAAKEADLVVLLGSAESKSGDGVYSNAGVDFTMTGATDNGISFSATVNIDAGTEVDTADFELDGADGGTAGLGAVSMTGTFGTLTFDDGGIDNLYDDDLAAADVSYSTTVGAVSLTVAHDTAGGAAANSLSAGYSASGMAFTLTASEAAGTGTSAKLAVGYALNDTVSISASTDQVASKESVQTIGAVTTLNGVSVSVSSANNSTWDVDLGYTAGGFALTYGVDETDHWTATATAALGGGATFATGVSSDNEMYAGVSFAF